MSSAETIQFFVDAIGQPFVMIWCVTNIVILVTLQCLHKQPVRNKYFLHLLLIARFLSCICQLLPVIPALQPYRCLTYSFGVLPVNFSALFVYFIVASQVLVAKRIQDLKQVYHQLAMESSDHLRMPLSIRILKGITSRFVALALYLVFITMIVGVHLLLYFVVARGDCLAMGNAVRFSVIVVYLGLALMILIVLIMDMYESRDDCLALKCWRPYTVDDPLVYRLELTCIVILLPLVLLCIVLLSLVLRVPNELSASIAKLIADVAQLVVIPGLSLVATVWQECKLVRVNHEKRASRASLRIFDPSEETIRMILADAQVAFMFRAFCKKEYSIENILFFEQVQEFKRKPSFELASKLYNMYLCNNAALEINVTQLAKQYVTDAMHLYETNKTPISANIFQACETIVVNNCLDTYRRFFVSGQFMDYMTAVENKQQGSSSSSKLMTSV